MLPGAIQSYFKSCLFILFCVGSFEGFFVVVFLWEGWCSSQYYHVVDDCTSM